MDGSYYAMIQKKSHENCFFQKWKEADVNAIRILEGWCVKWKQWIIELETSWQSC